MRRDNTVLYGIPSLTPPPSFSVFVVVVVGVGVVVVCCCLSFFLTASVIASFECGGTTLLCMASLLLFWLGGLVLGMDVVYVSGEGVWVACCSEMCV